MERRRVRLVILINTGIGIITELKAKRTLDKLSILVASDYLVRRDGKDVEVPHNEIVLGDLMWIRSGEQVPADAQIVRTWGLELDESMLTGESRTVRKNEGDDIYSGSTAVSGMALVKVNAVGAHSYAATLTAQAKVYKKDRVRLQQGHQHHPQIHDLPRRAAVRAAHLGRRCTRSAVGT